MISGIVALLLPTVVSTPAEGAAERPSARIRSGVVLRLSPEIEAGRPATRKLRLPEPSQNPLLEWNAACLDAVRINRLYPPPMTRIFAMMNLAVYDGLNTVTPRGSYYLGSVPTADTGSMNSAAVIAGACRQVLLSAMPGQAADWEALAGRQLAALPADDATSRGLALGAEAGRRMLQLRTGDGATNFTSFPGGTAPGVWRPTRPAFRPALSPHWPNVTTFALGDGDQFRPAAPPALGSSEYAEAYSEVNLLGEYFSDARSDEQTDIALFWEADAGSVTPPGYWAKVAMDEAERLELDQWQQARLLSLLGLTLADSAIAAWDAKYTHAFWRPVTAIPLAEEDGNPETAPVDQWISLLVTPPHPEYPSGHSTFSGAAAELLALEFGENPITIMSDGLLERYNIPEFSRSYGSYGEAAAEAGRSRIYGGIHYEFSNQAGLGLGRRIAKHVKSEFLVPNRTDTWVLY